jgi:hypothetical protein
MIKNWVKITLLNLPMLSKIQMPVEFAYSVFTYGVQNTKGFFVVLGGISHYNFDWVISPALWQSDLGCSDYPLELLIY